MRKIVVGTRTSKLALIQTNWVIDQLKKAGIKNEIVIKEFMTKGDRNLNVSLSKLGGGGIFIEEIEHALLQEQIDFAVHSLKDVPAQLPEELTISSVPVREDHRDAYIAKDGVKLMDLPSGAVIGTSSLRRSAQILAIRPDLQTKSIRGTVDSRLEQLEEGTFDAIILAVAGLNRLGLSNDVITQYLDSHLFVPAPGQGALAIECRERDAELRKILATINDENSAQAVLTERTLITLLEGAEDAPVGVYASVDGENIALRTSVTTSDGKQTINEVVRGVDPNIVAKEMVEKLIKQGADKIIQEVNDTYGI